MFIITTLRRLHVLTIPTTPMINDDLTEVIKELKDLTLHYQQTIGKLERIQQTITATALHIHHQLHHTYTHTHIFCVGADSLQTHCYCRPTADLTVLGWKRTH